MKKEHYRGLSLGEFLKITRKCPESTKIKIELCRDKIHYFFIQNIVLSNVLSDEFSLKFIIQSDSSECVTLAGFRNLTDKNNMQMMCEGRVIKSIDVDHRWNSIILRDK